MKVIFNDKYEGVEWFHIPSKDGINDKVQVSYKIKDEFIENDFNTSIAVASFTTSSARCRLYYALERLQRQVLYFDTDSVVYKYNPKNKNDFILENGDLLGEWTDELDGCKMVGTFVSGGPKNYSYETEDYKKGKYVGNSYHTKVKGFGLNYSVMRDINHNTIIDLVQSVLRGEETKIKVGYDMIKRGKGHTLSNEHQEKNYGLVYDKRSIMPMDKYGNYDTLPFGYTNIVK